MKTERSEVPTTYTEDDIQEAFGECETIEGEYVCIGDLIAELKRPKWQPQEGEVVATELPSGISYQSLSTNEFPSRPLNRTEVPALGVAIEALEDIAAESEMKTPTGKGWTYTYSEMAAKALTKIKGMIND